MSENRATKSGIARDVQQKVSHSLSALRCEVLYYYLLILSWLSMKQTTVCANEILNVYDLSRSVTSYNAAFAVSK